VGLLQSGETVDALPCRLASLNRAQVYECLTYYEDQLAKIDYRLARQLADPGK